MPRPEMTSAHQALLLCAGVGSRLRPLTDSVPKCLVPIAGVPLLEIWLAMLAKQGFDRIVVNMHHHRHLVAEFVKSSPWRDRIILIDEPELLGTAGTLKSTAHLFDKSKPVFLAHGDNLTTFDMRAFLEAHRTRPKITAMTMLSFVTSTPQSCGILQCDAEGVLQAFFEKHPNPPGNLANAAIYLLSREVVELVEALPGAFLDFSTQVIPKYMGRIFVHQNQGYHRDIGTVESWRLAQEEFPKAAKSSMLLPN